MKAARSFEALLVCLLWVLAGAASAQENAWTSHGPSDIGYVSDVAIAENAAFAATENGIFRSLDGGTSWQPMALAGERVARIHAGQGTPALMATVVSPDGETAVLYVSRDQGETWSRIPDLPPTMGAAIDPWHPGTIYAAVLDEPTILKSTDSGETWRPLPSIPVPDDRGRGFAFDSLAIYVLSWNERESSYLFYRSADDGATWTVVRPPLSYVYPLEGGGRPGVVYANGVEGFCRSTDSAATWSCSPSNLPRPVYRIHELPGAGTRILALGQDRLHISNDQGASWTEASATPGFSYGLTSLASDVSGSMALVGTQGGILRSQDRGEHWTVASTGLRSAIVRSLALDPRDSSTIWAETSLAGSSFPRLFRSTNDGFSWAPAGGPNTYIAPGTLVVDPADPATLYAGGEAIYRSGDGGASWTSSSPFGHYIRAIAVEPGSTGRVLAASSFGLHRSDDRAATWVSPPALAREVYSVLFDGRRPGRVYAGSYFDVEPGWYGYPFGGGLFVSQDHGVSFSKINFDFGSAVYAVIADPTQDGALYAGTFTNGVFRSVDDGAHWVRPGPQDVDIGYLIALVADPVRPDTLYASTALGVFRSTDGARTWQPFSSGLGSLRSGPLAISSDGRWLHVGTDGGGAYAMDLARSYPCVPNATRLCLVEKRYAVTLLDWWERTPYDARPLGDRAGFFTGDSGLPYVVVKMLPDGAFGAAGAPTFYSSLTAASWYFTVTDTITGRETTYGSRDDAPLCGGADLAFGDLDATVSHRAAPAVSSEGTLALLGGRFRIEVEASHRRSGRNGSGVVLKADDRFGILSLPDITGDSGFPEVVVEMVDAQAQTGKFELYHASLTSLDYTVTVTDTTNGASRTYQSTTPFCGAADTNAFSN